MDKTKSRLYTAKVTHSRLFPVKHSFLYDVFYFIIDLDELESGVLNNACFAHNALRPFSIHDVDYMGKEKRSIKSKLIDVYRDEYNKQKQQLQNIYIDDEEQQSNHNKNNSDSSTNTEHQLPDPNLINKVELVTMPRYLNMEFNPVSFYFCYAKDSSLLQIVVEINNTFGETHLYYPSSVVRDEQTPQFSINNEPYQTFATQNKDFHVSPFNSLDGSYIFCFSDIRSCFDIRINLLSTLKSTSLETTPEDKSFILTTRLWSKWPSKPLTNTNLVALLMGYPITALLTLPRIMMQAAKLHYNKRLDVYAKPNPPLENTTIIINASSLQIFAKNWFLEYLSTFPKGIFIFSNPDGSNDTVDNNNNSNNNNDNSIPIPENILTDSSKPIYVRVLNYEFYWKLYLYHHNSSGVNVRALGMSYMADDFRCDDMAALIAMLCDLTITSQNNKIIQKDSWGWLSKYIDQSQLSKYYQSPSVFTTHCCTNSCEIQNEIEKEKIESQHYQYIIEKLKLDSTDDLLILEPVSSDLLKKISKDIECKITILTKKANTFRVLKQHYNDNSLVTIHLIDENETYNSILNSEINTYSKIMAIEVDMESKSLVNLCQKLLTINGLAYIQSVIGPFHPYQEIDLKPTLSPSYWQRYYHKKSELESKYWSMIAKFTHNPFALEQRYISVLSSIDQKGYINGHISSHQSIEIQKKNTSPNMSRDIMEMIASGSIDLQLLEMENIGDSYPSILQYNLAKLKLSKNTLLKDLQEEAMKNGCDLKMNESDLLEIYRTIQFHHYYLIASFKTVWSVSKLLLKK